MWIFWNYLDLKMEPFFNVFNYDVVFGRDLKLMYIPNNDTRNYPFCKLKLVVEMFEHT